MKLAYFSPLNPQPSGISDYSEELLPYLQRHAEIDLYVEGFKPVNVNLDCAVFDYRKDPASLYSLNNYDAVIYQMGNDHRYHAGMLEVARSYPGIVVFHDFALQDFFLGLAQQRGRQEIYLEEVMACHGRRVAREAAEALARGALPKIIERPLDFPLNCRLARRAEGIVVHSEWSRAQFAQIVPSVPVARINMPVRSIPERERKSTNPATVRIANFGLITPGKGIEQALRALSALKGDHDFHYTLVGQPNSFFDVRALVRHHGMEDRVTITGHVSLEEFEKRICATDIALNLRERTVGETSASLCRLMAAGVPAIVFDVGAFSELPNDAVIKIAHDEHADVLLREYLRRLIEDGELRHRLGQNARRHMLSEHTIEQSAADYAAFAGKIIARRPRRHFFDQVAAEIVSLNVPADDETLLRSVAEEVAVLVPDVQLTEMGSAKPVSQRDARPLSGSATDADANGNHTAHRQQVEDSNGRLPKIAGIDYKRAAVDYPRMLDEERNYYLRTKPFYNLANKPEKHLGDGMDAETHRHFTDFANMARALALPAGAKILDVGCGSGWLSEYFARLGYDVTGIDISDDLVRMARERVAKIPYNVDHATPLRCRFITCDIEVKPLGEKFDAVICYDSLHHFEDEHAVFRHLAAMLDGGGLLFILEGHKPSAGSATEDELQGVMRQYGTLESPFSGQYLRRLLDEHGLAVVGDYVSVNGLFERELLEDERLPLRGLDTNYHYLTCIKVAEDKPAGAIPDSRHPGLLRAQFTLVDAPPEQVEAGTKLNFTIAMRNTGDTLWLTGQGLRPGIVMPAVRLIDARGEIVSEVHGQPLLPRAVAPGQTIMMNIPFRAPLLTGKYKIKIDLVDQHICWFEERGSQPIEFDFEVVEA